MNLIDKSFLVAVMAALLGGIAWLRMGRKAQGGALFALAIAAMLIFYPWQAATWLDVRSIRFHQWFAPRGLVLGFGWSLSAVAAGASAAFKLAAVKPGPRLSDWETPKASPAVDMLLSGRLKTKVPGRETFLGLANGGRRADLAARERDGHMQIVGPTRSGKSQLLLAIAAQDMNEGMPLFFMEAKGDKGDFDQFLKTASLADRVTAVRYFNPHDERSMTFNPIRPVSGQNSTAVANQIARAIGREPSSSGEGQDYYRAVDSAKIQSMVEVFFATKKAFTLRDCYDYFAFVEARAYALELCADRRLADLVDREFKANPDSSGLTSALRPWTTGHLGDLLNSYSPQIRLEDVFDQKQAAYFAIPIGHLQTLANPLGRMVISGLLSVAAERQRTQPKPGPATVILDEFAEFATPVFASFIATVGSARLRTILSHQDLGQLQRVEGMNADAFESVVFNNTSGAKVCFRAPNPDDAEFWGKMLGTYNATRDTQRFEADALGGEHNTGGVSRRIVERFKVHPNLLKSLEAGTALVMAPGRVECLVRTARVREIVNKLAVPKLVAPVPAAEEGLDLRSAVPEYRVQREVRA